MIERLKIPQPANDNYSSGELREQRKNILIKHAFRIIEVDNWLQRNKAKVSKLHSFDDQDIDDHSQAVAASLSALGEALKAAGEALDRAEQEPEHSETFPMAEVAMAVLEGAFDEAETVINH